MAALREMPHYVREGASLEHGNGLDTFPRN